MRSASGGQFLRTPLALTPCSFDIATCFDFDPHHLGRSNEQRYSNAEAVIEGCFLPGAVLLQVRRRCRTGHAGLDYVGEDGADRPTFEELYRQLHPRLQELALSRASSPISTRSSLIQRNGSTVIIRNRPVLETLIAAETVCCRIC